MLSSSGRHWRMCCWHGLKILLLLPSEQRSPARCPQVPLVLAVVHGFIAYLQRCCECIPATVCCPCSLQASPQTPPPARARPPPPLAAPAPLLCAHSATPLQHLGLQLGNISSAQTIIVSMALALHGLLSPDRYRLRHNRPHSPLLLGGRRLGGLSRRFIRVRSYNRQRKL